MLIVDGDNVPNPFRPWHQRAWHPHVRLVIDLVRLTRSWSSCVDLVFDGDPRVGLRNGVIVEGVRVLFALRASADDRIVTLVRELREESEPAHVVTSDRGLAERAATLGAAVVSSECLRRALDRVAGAAHLGLAVRSPLLAGPEALIPLDRADGARR